MKFSIDRAALLRALNHVQSVVEKRNTIPILSNVLMRAEDGVLSMATTDMDLEMNEAVAAEVDKPGATTAPAHTLHDIVRKMPDGVKIELEVSEDGHSMQVRGGRSNFRLACLPISDFPELGLGDLPTTFSVPAAELRALIDRTKFAMSTEETRYYLNGIYVHAADADGIPVLRAVATDGHRLARFEMPIPEGAGEMPGVIVPRKAVNEIRRLLEEAADQISISLSENKIRFAFDHIVLTSKLIDGTFPDYNRVIPVGNDKMIEVDPKVFTQAIDRVSTISDGKSRAVKIQLNGKTMTLSANSAESGSAMEDIEVNSEAPNIEIGFNAKYLLDITSQVSGDGCRMEMADPASPTIIQDTSDASALYVLMPLRV
ncbi:MAG: DNA polymerase III subunit beta [Pseudomonadota bacterium]|nr:DNA polymerase III subunit beta [Alphaproteobacteria bacterium]MCS5595757.1 DNA polymerase III subunit beta [Alphaproteobacteria bacterium]MEC7575883.1 DNA polymerase III subunit beta [Pseudomonadota bacterium]MEC7702805.1 DNA polymerase III subunit beta [Pseudomonadota bacterium]MED5423755.1 DNA polymerase III subunit beta [Pseudomonadota bacterium]|tara:strand:- start:3319 stop:4437 length:1119 start_codon:yes stop_codon:yes gene_type:complete